MWYTYDLIFLQHMQTSRPLNKLPNLNEYLCFMQPDFKWKSETAKTKYTVNIGEHTVSSDDNFWKNGQHSHYKYRNIFETEKELLASDLNALINKH